MAKKYSEKVACKPINTSLTLGATSVQLGGTKKNDSVSSLSIEKKSVKIGG